MADLNINDVLIDIDDYTIIKKIGEGGFGTVFLATENKTKKQCALKIMIETDTLKKKKDQMNVLREVCVPRILKLPGIVKMIGFRFPLTETELKTTKLLKLDGAKFGSKKKEIDLTGPIIITEYMKNGSLEKKMSEYLRTKGASHDLINPTVRSKIVFGVAATMKYVHRHQVIHRDLKLENVFLDDNSEPRIADFGLAKVVFGDTKMTMAIGTPIAMAPELFIDGDETYTLSVDVYAYAFLLYKMFSNSLLFNSARQPRSPQQYMMQISKGHRPKKPEDIPEHYWELITNCWKQDPADRPSFEEITELLKSDQFAINEFGMKTDLDQLHEYQARIDKDFDSPTAAKPVIVLEGEKKILLRETSDKRKGEKVPRKTKFIWTRH